MMCQTYTIGYYPKLDNTTSCFNGDIAGYALVGSIYQKCHNNCLACTDKSTPTVMKSSFCKIGLYLAFDNDKLLSSRGCAWILLGQWNDVQKMLHIL
jgi:hypothetical protein